MKQPNLDAAIRIYYQFTEIGNAEIREIFGVRGETACKLKRMAREVMVETNVRVWDAYSVNTKCAYHAWGLDIDDMEKRRHKLQKLGLLPQASETGCSP